MRKMRRRVEWSWLNVAKKEAEFQGILMTANGRPGATVRIHSVSVGRLSGFSQKLKAGFKPINRHEKPVFPVDGILHLLETQVRTRHS